MAKQPYISHVVNGYSRYDLPESVAFTCTPGILYPVRVDFINARDRVTIDQGIDVRSNPLAVPSFNPYTVRLHRFWVPLQLYHPEMRTNSSAFDMNDLSLNWFPFGQASDSVNVPLGDLRAPAPNSLMAWLRLAGHATPVISSEYIATSLPASALASDVQTWWNADTYLAYWDIVRNYYSYSQWKTFSFAWPGGFYQFFKSVTDSYSTECITGNVDLSYFTQRYGNLEFLDAYFESQFYPNAVESENGTYNRSNLFAQIVASDLGITGQSSSLGAQGDGYPVLSIYAGSIGGSFPSDQFGSGKVSITASSSGAPAAVRMFSYGHPMAVVPSSPDRFSRLLPPGASNSSVSMSGVTTIPQLAVAARLQEYKDLLGAGGSRFSDWLETFFASKIEHVDRPKLLFSASQTVNVQVVLNQSGEANFDGSYPLGAQGGAIAFNSKLGRSQSYYFREPGYMIDMFSIRPVYYWSGVVPDYMKYQGSDYFNPVYNDIGYQDVASSRLGTSASSAGVFAQEPCFNEFRASYDTVLGQFVSGEVTRGGNSPLYSYWVQQRKLDYAYTSAAYSVLFVDMTTVNSPFASPVEDNFFVNLSYSVRKKNLVNKTFATRLANR